MLVFVHLFNDCSGSPRVLQSVIAAIGRNSAQCGRDKLLIGSDGAGCLDEVHVPIVKFWFKRSSVRLITLLTYSLSQALLFFKLLLMRDVDKQAVIYVNTLMPSGAALFGRLTGRPVIYHLHEVSISPPALMKLLVAVARFTATQLIYVSNFHREQLPIPGVPACTILNALDPDFAKVAQAHAYEPVRAGRFNVLMLASLRPYKGIAEFMDLAARCAHNPSIHFHLVANDEAEDVARFFGASAMPSNVTVYPRTKAPAAHYKSASLVLNLSRPDQWVETFGMTLLEAMAYGIPVIAPPIGGPAELIEHGREGYLMDCRDGDALAQVVSRLATNPALCVQHSQAARERAAHFTPERFAAQLNALLHSRGWLPTHLS